MDFYKNTDGLYKIGDNYVSPGKSILKVYQDLTAIELRSSVDFSVIMPPIRILFLQREDGSYYLSVTGFITENIDFFMGPDGKGIPVETFVQDIFGTIPEVKLDGKFYFLDKTGNGNDVKINTMQVGTFNGTTYLTFDNLNGATIISYIGTSVPTKISDQRINVTIGYLISITFSDGTSLIFNHGQGSTIWDIGENKNNAIVVATDFPAFWGSTSNDIEPYELTIGAAYYKRISKYLGNEMINNGNFDINTSGWVLQTGYSWANGKVYGNTVTNNFMAQINKTVIAGKTYEITVTIGDWERGEPYVSLSGAASIEVPLTPNSINIFNILIDTGSSTASLNFYAGTVGVGGKCSFDSISLREVDPNVFIGSIMPICISPEEIQKYTFTYPVIPNFEFIGYYPPGSGVAFGLPNTYLGIKHLDWETNAVTADIIGDSPDTTKFTKEGGEVGISRVTIKT